MDGQESKEAIYLVSTSYSLGEGVNKLVLPTEVEKIILLKGHRLQPSFYLNLNRSSFWPYEQQHHDWWDSKKLGKGEDTR